MSRDRRRGDLFGFILFYFSEAGMAVIAAKKKVSKGRGQGRVYFQPKIEKISREISSFLLDP